MARDAGKKSFLDFFKMKDLDDDEFDDDLFDDDVDDDDDDDEVYVPKSRAGRTSSKQVSHERTNYSNTYSTAAKPQQTASYSQSKQAQPRTASNNSKLVDFNNGRQQKENYRGKSEVYVIKPQEISESQTVTDFLKNGKTIVINMEGLELAPAQRIIDFIGGACYALNGSLQAISANIFIAAPASIEVSGDLREEILNDSTVSPQLGKY